MEELETTSLPGSTDPETGPPESVRAEHDRQETASTEAGSPDRRPESVRAEHDRQETASTEAGSPDRRLESVRAEPDRQETAPTQAGSPDRPPESVRAEHDRQETAPTEAGSPDRPAAQPEAAQPEAAEPQIAQNEPPQEEPPQPEPPQEEPPSGEPDRREPGPPELAGPTLSVDELMQSNEQPAILAPQEDIKLKAVLEAVIYVAEEPLTVAQIAASLQEPRERVSELLEQLIEEFETPGHGVCIREIAGGFKMATKPEHHDAVRNFVKSLKPPLKLSLPALETLAVIAYKQPVTGPEVLEIRGVQGGGVMKTLLDRKLIAAAGRKNVVGKPILYKTTKEFLIQFGLKDLSELPSLKEFEEIRRMAFDTDAPPPPPAAEAAATGESIPELIGVPAEEAPAEASTEAEATESSAPAPGPEPDPPQEPS